VVSRAKQARSLSLRAGLLIAAGIALVIFYLLPPLFLGDTLGGVVALLLLINPLFCLLCGVFFSLYYGFYWPLAPFLAALFTPGVFLFYNESAAVYILLYAALTLIGSCTGLLFGRGRRVK